MSDELMLILLTLILIADEFYINNKERLKRELDSWKKCQDKKSEEYWKEHESECDKTY